MQDFQKGSNAWYEQIGNITDEMQHHSAKWHYYGTKRNWNSPMKIRELPILARIDPKTPKTHVAAKKCCGWEKPAICVQSSLPKQKWHEVWLASMQVFTNTKLCSHLLNIFSWIYKQITWLFRSVKCILTSFTAKFTVGIKLYECNI